MNNLTRRDFAKFSAVAGLGTALGHLSTRAHSAEFVGRWSSDVERVWVGPDYWANRLQDWRVAGGRLECVASDNALPFRTVHLLTRRLGSGDGDLQMSVRIGRIGGDGKVADDAAAGFLVGAGATMDYRGAALVHCAPGVGGGLLAGINAQGAVFFRDFEKIAEPVHGHPAGKLPADVTLRLVAKPAADDKQFVLTLTALDTQTGREISRIVQKVQPDRLVGNVALFSHPGSGKPLTLPSPQGGEGGRFWFQDWQVSGTRVEEHPDRRLGPILCTQYTLHNGILKLTAQLTPIGQQDGQEAKLQVRRGTDWETVATARVVVPGYTVPFRVEKWDASEDVPFRVVYEYRTAEGKPETAEWTGTVRRDPVDKETLVFASLSCVQQVNGRVDSGKTYGWANSVWFPHADLVPNVARHQADLLFFAGDQIYENNPTRAVREPLEEALLDYLYKWYLWCWAYGDLVRHTPCICIPDDHDVYHGNIWGMGGAPSREEDPVGLFGGYGMPPAWLNMMQRTQTSHLPDPFDPTPAAQGIGVYYTSLVWGGIGFAILEDRKFKSSPALVKARMTRDSHILDYDFDTRKADVPGATLLGERQLKFLRHFAEDWHGQVMKAVLSQTIFCNLQISSRGETAGKLDRDLDSNGWPQSGRRRALEEMRRGFMIHLAGDQHLASALQHGIDDFEDAGWSLCSPAISNLYIRFWNPDYPPLNYREGMPPYMGRYEDGFHNKLTVHAVANPVNDPKPGQFPEPVELHRKATGYAMVRFNKKERTITLEVWPRYVDPADPKTGGQYPGWPITIRQEDNYGRKAAAYLPTLKVQGATDPVVRIVNMADDELVYALRIRGTEFRPKVFAPGMYRVFVEAGGKTWQRTLSSLPEGETASVVVEL